MVDESSIKVTIVNRKVICLAIQRLVVVLEVDCNALEHASDLDYIPEVPVV